MYIDIPRYSNKVSFWGTTINFRYPYQGLLPKRISRECMDESFICAKNVKKVISAYNIGIEARFWKSLYFFIIFKPVTGHRPTFSILRWGWMRELSTAENSYPWQCLTICLQLIDSRKSNGALLGSNQAIQHRMCQHSTHIKNVWYACNRIPTSTCFLVRWQPRSAKANIDM